MFFNKQKQVCDFEECKICNEIPEKLKKCKSCGHRIVCRSCFYKGEKLCVPCDDECNRVFQKYDKIEEYQQRCEQQVVRRQERLDYGMAGGNAYIFEHYRHEQQAGIV
jgi:hypothetical protein